jgi:hypothetical protein
MYGVNEREGKKSARKKQKDTLITTYRSQTAVHLVVRCDVSQNPVNIYYKRKRKSHRETKDTLISYTDQISQTAGNFNRSDTSPFTNLAEGWL